MAVALVLLIGMVGIAIDAAYVGTVAQQLQNAADASSLAAVQVVKSEANPLDPTNPFPLTRKAAVLAAKSNDAASTAVKLDPNPSNDPTGDVVIGFWDANKQNFTPDLLNPNAVRVRARRMAGHGDGSLALLFGPVFGVNTSDVGSRATAVMAPAAWPYILVLHPDLPWAMELNGTAFLAVPLGKVHVNSIHNKSAIRLVGTIAVQAMQTSVCGAALYPDGAISGPLLEGADYVPDPLAHLLPDEASWDAFRAAMPQPLGPNGQIDGTGTYDPGFYPEGMELDAGDQVVLNPGFYMFGGSFDVATNTIDGGIQLHGSARVTADGVTLFIDEGAVVDVSGSGAGMQMTPTASGPFQGVALFHHRENDQGPKDWPADCKIGGGGLFQVEGYIYVPSGHFEMAGTPGKKIGGIITNTLDNNGTTGFFITGKGLPPPTGPEYPFLVQ
jgi:hypothetical protein